jgi:GxxExxY protein
VSNILGAGFLEKLYERALIEELRLRGIPSAAQGKHIGTYAADLVVDGRLLVEIKSTDQLSHEHLAQCINYLKASGLHLALLINFRKSRVEWRRVVHNDSRSCPFIRGYQTCLAREESAVRAASFKSRLGSFSWLPRRHR